VHDEELDTARWATIAAELDPRAGRPDSTLKPAVARSYSAATAFGNELHGDEARVVVHEVLGEGGMGVVRRATQTRLRRDVAVKSVRAAQVSAQRRTELLQEAWVTGALEHPNILPVYGIEVGPDSEPLVLLKRLGTTRWLDLMHDAEALRSQLGRDDLVEWNLQVFMQICQAVHFAHSRRILHLDLKPENVMIGEFGEVYLVDWGIAMSLEDDGSGRFRIASKNKEILGTPTFLAPEMLAGDGSLLDERTDVYLLGACLYFLTEGQPIRNGESLMEVLHDAILKQPPAPTAAPPELAAVIETALSRDRAQRQATADELRRAVQAFIDHRDSRTRSNESIAVLHALKQATGRATNGEQTPRAESHGPIQETFDKCRIGFHGALGVWPENPQALQGLDAMFVVMAWYELARADLETAAAHVAQLESPPPELLAALDIGKDHRLRTRARAAKLEKLDANLDIATGQRTRTFVVGVIALAWIVLPLVRAASDSSPTSFSTLLALPIGYLLAIVALTAWARESLWRTAINRRLIGALAAAMGGEVAATTVLYVLDAPVVLVLPMSFVIWATVGWMVVANIDRRLWPTAVIASLGCISAAIAPYAALPMVSGVSFALLLNVTIVWWPWSASAKRARAKLGSS